MKQPSKRATEKIWDSGLLYRPQIHFILHRLTSTCCLCRYPETIEYFPSAAHNMISVDPYCEMFQIKCKFLTYEFSNQNVIHTALNSSCPVTVVYDF